MRRIRGRRTEAKRYRRCRDHCETFTIRLAAPRPLGGREDLPGDPIVVDCLGRSTEEMVKEMIELTCEGHAVRVCKEVLDKIFIESGKFAPVSEGAVN